MIKNLDVGATYRLGDNGPLVEVLAEDTCGPRREVQIRWEDGYMGFVSRELFDRFAKEVNPFKPGDVVTSRHGQQHVVHLVVGATDGSSRFLAANRHGEPTNGGARSVLDYVKVGTLLREG